MAETLLGREISAAPGVFATLLAVRRGASRRSAAEARLLAQAVDTGTAVRIDYLSSTRSTTSRIIEDLEPDGGAWTPGAYCANGQRRFTLTDHYTDGNDNPAWIGASDGTWTRYVDGAAGGLALSVDNTGTVQLQLPNLHGDTVATCTAADTMAALPSLANRVFDRARGGRRTSSFQLLRL